MRLLKVFLVLLLLCSPAIAGDVAIDGPDKIEAGARPVKYAITGATVQDLVKGGAKLVWYPRDNISVWEAATWTGEPYMLVSAGKPGKYLLAVTFAADGKLVYTEQEIVVGGDDPNPPLPPPPPGGKKQVALVIKSAELDNLPQSQQAIVASLKLRQSLEAKGHRFLGILEANQAASAPPELAPFYKAADGDALPRIAVAPLEGGTITDYPLPATEADLWKLVDGGSAQ
jgi:hypothetical protein